MNHHATLLVGNLLMVLAVLMVMFAGIVVTRKIFVRIFPWLPDRMVCWMIGCTKYAEYDTELHKCVCKRCGQ